MISRNPWTHKNFFHTRVRSSHRPILWFVKGKFKRTIGNPMVRDTLNPTNSEWREAKKHHVWGQPECYAKNWVEGITQPGDIVVDPFVGGGSTLAVCNKINRVFVGFDSSFEACQKASQRINNHVPEKET